MPGGSVNKTDVIIRPAAVTIPSVPAETLPVQYAERLSLGSLCSLQFFFGYSLPLEILPVDPHLMQRDRQLTSDGNARL